MEKKFLIPALLMMIFLFPSCDLSGILGIRSVAFTNNSDAPVTITLGDSEFTIDAESTSPSIVPDEKAINDGEITVTLEGIYYYETSRSYSLGQNVITLNPDCYWLRLKNSTDEVIKDFSIPLSYNENSYPRATQDFAAEKVEQIAPEAEIYFPMIEQPGDNFSAQFTVGDAESTSSAGAQGITLEIGKTSYIVLEKTEESYVIVPWTEAEGDVNTGV